MAPSCWEVLIGFGALGWFWGGAGRGGLRLGTPVWTQNIVQPFDYINFAHTFNAVAGMGFDQIVLRDAANFTFPASDPPPPRVSRASAPEPPFPAPSCRGRGGAGVDDTLGSGMSMGDAPQASRNLS